MRKTIAIAVALSLVTLAGCSMVQDFFRNVTAKDCSSPAAEQAFVNNLPFQMIPETQAVAALDQLCTGLYGPQAAPSTAPGNSPVFPASSPSPAPSAVASPAVSK